MVDKERNALIPLPSGGLENIGSGPKSILSGMVSDALALVRAREKSLAAARFRIGEYEFRDPDYRQILIWAKVLGIKPEVFISGLKEDFEKYEKYENSFDSYDDVFKNGLRFPDSIYFLAGLEVEDGSIVSLMWDFDSFPISSFEWVDGLSIKRLWFRGSVSTKISLPLPSLNIFNCSGCGLTELDLSAVPALTSLWCHSNQLVALDLSAVPALTELLCDDNRLVELDLSAVPALTELQCSGNRLVELDLSSVPALTELRCRGNRLVELDLSTVPALTGLRCDYNQLVELDLSAVPELSGLWCDYNKLVELDLSVVPELTHLWCSSNQLVELDIRALGQLRRLSCDPPIPLKKLPTQNF